MLPEYREIVNWDIHLELILVTILKLQFRYVLYPKTYKMLWLYWPKMVQWSNLSLIFLKINNIVPTRLTIVNKEWYIKNIYVRFCLNRYVETNKNKKDNRIFLAVISTRQTCPVQVYGFFSNFFGSSLSEKDQFRLRLSFAAPHGHRRPSDGSCALSY